MNTFYTQRPVRQRVAEVGADIQEATMNVVLSLSGRIFARPTRTDIGASQRNAERHDRRRFVGNHEKMARLLQVCAAYINKLAAADVLHSERVDRLAQDDCNARGQSEVHDGVQGQTCDAPHRKGSPHLAS